MQHAHNFPWKPEGLSVDKSMGWRMWTRFMCLRDCWWAFVNSHITGRCHKIGVSTSTATVNHSRRTSCHMVGLYKSRQTISYVQKIQYFIASAEKNLVNCVV